MAFPKDGRDPFAFIFLFKKKKQPGGCQSLKVYLAKLPLSIPLCKIHQRFIGLSLLNFNGNRSGLRQQLLKKICFFLSSSGSFAHTKDDDQIPLDECVQR